jgi:hypothetical protein
MDNTIPTDGQLLVGIKYLPNTSDLRYFGSPIPLSTLYNQYFQPYTTSNIQKPHGNWHVSTWLCMDNTIPTNGQLLVGTKYLPNTSD